jgi:hypothetical protein
VLNVGGVSAGSYVDHTTRSVLAEPLLHGGDVRLVLEGVGRRRRSPRELGVAAHEFIDPIAGERAIKRARERVADRAQEGAGLAVRVAGSFQVIGEERLGARVQRNMALLGSLLCTRRMGDAAA